MVPRQWVMKLGTELFLLLVLGITLPTFAQSSFVSDLLRAITARIDGQNSTTGKAGSCLGFVATVRWEVAYVATAKHCVEELNAVKLTPTTVDPTLVITVAYSNGATGIPRRLFWDKNTDDLVIAATFDDRPPSLAGECPGCTAYTGFFGQSIPVLSLLSAGGGPPVVSSGTLVSDQFGRYFVALPSAPGTSGAAILDLRGNLVGIVVSGLVIRSTEATWMTGIVPGGLVLDLVRYAVDRMESSIPSPPAPA